MADLLAPDLASVDQVALVMNYLRNHPANIDLLGGPGHVSGLIEAPWPHVFVHDGPGGSLRNLRWETELEVTLEVIGAPDGSPGISALRRLALRQMQLATQMPDADYTPGQPVVSNVVPSGVLADAPLTNGQPRFIVGLLVTAHPSRTPAL